MTDLPLVADAAAGLEEPQALLILERGCRGHLLEVLPKSTAPVRIRQNADLFSFALDDEDVAAIADMDRGAGVAWPTGDPTSLA